MTTKPITPDDDRLKLSRGKRIPDNIMTIINSMIISCWNGREATFKLKDIQEAITKETGFTKEQLHNAGFLDIEPVFEAAGWRVVYNEPRIGENQYDSFFRFTRRSDKPDPDVEWINFEAAVPSVIYGRDWEKYRERVFRMLIDGEIAVSVEYNRSPWDTEKHPEDCLVWVLKAI